MKKINAVLRGLYYAYCVRYYYADYFACACSCLC